MSKTQSLGILFIRLLLLLVAHVATVLLLTWAFKRATPPPLDLGCAVLVVPAVLAMVAHSYFVLQYIANRLPKFFAILVSAVPATVLACTGYALGLFFIVKIYGS